MGNIYMKGNEFEDITTNTFTFLTPTDEDSAINSAMAVLQLAQAMDVYCSKPIMVNRRAYPWASKWSIIVKGTYTEIGLFREEARTIVKQA